MSLEVDIARLVSDPEFSALERDASRPTFFDAIGRTFTETWHSSFLGWLLDPRGSHRLGAFPLKAFLTGIAANAQSPTGTHERILTPDALARLVATTDFDDADVVPNERQPREKAIGSGRIDVAIELVLPDKQRFACLIEMKVKAGLSDGQATGYADWLLEQPDRIGVCVFIGPPATIKETSEGTTGDARWYCCDFQQVHDRLLLQVAAHEDLDPEMKPLVRHYVRNLRSAVHGTMLAMTENDRTLVEAIWKRHHATFRKMAEVLERMEADPSDRSVINRVADGPPNEEPLIIHVAGAPPIMAGSGRELLEETIRYLDKTGHLASLDIPYATGKGKRWLLNRAPIHKDAGHAFIAPVKLETQCYGTLYFEANVARARALTQSQQLLQDAGVETAG